MIVAQVSPEMLTGMNSFLLSAASLMFIGLMGIKLIKEFRGSPGEPPNGQLKRDLEHLAASVHEISTTLKDHVKTNHEDHEGIHRKIGGVERGAQANLQEAIRSGNVSREHLATTINGCLTSMGELRGKCDILIAKIK